MSGSSLRLRLFGIIVLPLVILAALVGAWRIGVAQKTAQDLFDRNLLVVAIAVSRDVALSDGDVLSYETEQLLKQSAGGAVRYHVYGPDGVLVTGFAVPPIAPGSLRQEETFAYYDATYRNRPARVLRLKDETTIDGFSGTFTITVWQDLTARNGFVWALAVRSAIVMATLLGGLAVLVWFGVRLGLKPLTDLEEAISRRSPEDLTMIRRTVPVEVGGIVSQLNVLLTRIGETFEAQAAFISNAAHQLRNPVAGMQALAESITTATTLDAAHRRAGELARAAGQTGQLANRLLTLERAWAESGTEGFVATDLAALVAETVRDHRAAAERGGVRLDVSATGPLSAPVDPVMMREALANLIDNALVHGGRGLTTVEIALTAGPDGMALAVTNDGTPVAAHDIPRILARFGQIEPGAGSGLGLSIAEAVARRHGGTLDVDARASGFRVVIRLPASALAVARLPERHAVSDPVPA